MHEQQWMSQQLDRMEEMSGRFFRYFHTRIGEEGGLSPSQFFLLKLLERGGVRTVSDLASHLGMTAAGATGLIDRLVKQELVVRRRDEEDRRIVWVELSPNGADKLAEARRLRRNLMAELFSPLTREEVEQMIRLYQKITDGIPATGRLPGKEGEHCCG